MSTITPILDTLLHQVHGRRADMARFAGGQTRASVLAIDPVAPMRTEVFDKPPFRQGLSGGLRQSGEVTGTRHEQPLLSAGNGLPRAAGKTSIRPPDSTALHLSREGDLIAALARSPSPAVPDKVMAPLFHAARVPTTGVLAILLGQQVAQSGIFYESHLSQWLDGRRTLEQLRQEPQGRMRAGAAEAPPVGGASDAAALIDERLLPIVRRQFDALDASIFCWHGMAWPGANMQWDIREQRVEADGRSPTHDAAERSVSTRLRLDLPALGTVEVCLSLTASNRIEVYAWAQSDRSMAKLQPAAPALEQRLQQAGFATASVQLLSERDT